MNIRVHIADSAPDSVSDLIDAGYTVNMGSGAMLVENLFGIIYPDYAFDHDSTYVRTDLPDAEDIKSMLNSLTFYVWESEVDTYYQVIDMHKGTNGWVVHYDAGTACMLEDIIIDKAPEKGLDDVSSSYDEHVTIIKKQPLKNLILKRKIRF